MIKAALIFCVVISLGMVGYGQRTITNSTLDKFKQKRLAAERDYRENYARLGFPSPEELDRQRDADRTARLQLAEQLRQARLEKERLELERRNLDLEAIRIDNEIEANAYQDFYGGYVTGFGGFGGFGGFDFDRRFRRRGPRPPFAGFGFGNRRFVTPRNGYRVTPFQVIPVPNPRPARILRGRPR
jgi:hypothetical protein